MKQSTSQGWWWRRVPIVGWRCGTWRWDTPPQQCFRRLHACLQQWRLGTMALQQVLAILLQMLVGLHMLIPTGDSKGTVHMKAMPRVGDMY